MKRHHEIIREELYYWMLQLAPKNPDGGAVPQFNLSANTFVKPDVLVRPRAHHSEDVSGADVLLVVEVAGASLDYDINTKLPLYASYGVREY